MSVKASYIGIETFPYPLVHFLGIPGQPQCIGLFQRLAGVQIVLCHCLVLQGASEQIIQQHTLSHSAPILRRLWECLDKISHKGKEKGGCRHRLARSAGTHAKV